MPCPIGKMSPPSGIILLSNFLPKIANEHNKYVHPGCPVLAASGGSAGWLPAFVPGAVHYFVSASPDLRGGYPKNLGNEKSLWIISTLFETAESSLLPTILPICGFLSGAYSQTKVAQRKSLTAVAGKSPCACFLRLLNSSLRKKAWRNMKPGIERRNSEKQRARRNCLARCV